MRRDVGEFPAKGKGQRAGGPFPVFRCDQAMADFAAR
ncbi:hypothetical protein GGR17_001955 [Confluentimicrobium naphthalenivorans]|uniref:Uncharacterized protein n=1 Tax=Actibacterium naphthalenivorans TaxID=1614693 RepID=A0A840CH78_9RHOB|nr:hypothetical protein [Actibacterium naphthalenivorans]